MHLSVTENSAAVTRVALKGPLDEHAAAVFLELKSLIKGSRLELDLDKIEHVNSMGLATWCSFIRELPKALSYGFVRCPRIFLDAASILPNLFGRGSVESFYLPYQCRKCGREHDVLLNKTVLAGKDFPDQGCAACKSMCAPTLSLEECQALLQAE